jgi:hypothetical protein
MDNTPAGEQPNSVGLNFRNRAHAAVTLSLLILPLQPPRYSIVHDTGV